MALYSKTNWQNNVTPVDQTNMNKIEQGIYDCSANGYFDCTVDTSTSSGVANIVITFKNAGGTQVGSAKTKNLVPALNTVFYTKSDADGRYYTKSYIDSNYYTKAWVDSCFTQVNNIEED